MPPYSKALDRLISPRVRGGVVGQGTSDYLLHLAPRERLAEVHRGGEEGNG